MQSQGRAGDRAVAARPGLPAMVRTNLVVAIAGAVVIALAASGLMEIGSRAGPYDARLQVAGNQFGVQGTYVNSPRQGSEGPGGLCVPPPSGGLCSPPRLEVTLRLTGLPRVGAYVAFLTQRSEVLPLGTMAQQGDSLVLEFKEQREGNYGQLVVAHAPQADQARSNGLLVYGRDVTGQGRDAPLSLTTESNAIVAKGVGVVRVTEIGAASISVTAIGSIAGAQPREGWVQHAWLRSYALPPSFTLLGNLEWSETGLESAVLDARVENIRLEDQERLLITLEPDGTPVGASPRGLHLYEAVFEA